MSITLNTNNNAVNINTDNVNSTSLSSNNVSDNALSAQIKEKVAQLNLSAEDQATVTSSVGQIVSTPGFDFSKMSIDSVISAVMLDRYDALRDLTEKQADKVQQLNNQLRGLGQLKADLAAYGSNVSNPDDTIDLNKPGSKLDEMKALAKEYGLNIDWSSFGLKEGTTITQGNLAKLNTTIDSMTTNTTNIQSTEYNKLQDDVQKMTGALNLASNTSKAFFDANSGIVANMR